MPVFYSLLSDCRWRRHPLRAGVSFIQVLSNLYIHNSFYTNITLYHHSLFIKRYVIGETILGIILDLLNINTWDTTHSVDRSGQMAPFIRKYFFSYVYLFFFSLSLSNAHHPTIIEDTYVYARYGHRRSPCEGRVTVSYSRNLFFFIYQVIHTLYPSRVFVLHFNGVVDESRLRLEEFYHNSFVRPFCMHTVDWIQNHNSRFFTFKWHPKSSYFHLGESDYKQHSLGTKRSSF